MLRKLGEGSGGTPERRQHAVGKQQGLVRIMEDVMNPYLA